MWIFLNDAFVSVVAHNERPADLLVRARIAGDLERAFPGCSVEVTPRADYRYRTVLPRTEVAAAIARRLEAIDYPNFKGSIGFGDGARYRAYHDVFDVMLGEQVIQNEEGFA